MDGFARAKRVTDPLDDKAQARIVGKAGREPVYVSSGSEHGGENDDGSPCLSDLIHGFLETYVVGGDSPDYESDSEHEPSMTDPTDVFEDQVNPIFMNNVDEFRTELFARVSQAMAAFCSVKSNKPVFGRNVMAFIRELGYNAAICKTKWESSGGLTAGNYEFIDVVRSDSGKSQLQRYFVDLDFSGEFVIARSTHQYERLLKAFPSVFVGRNQELKQIVKIMSDAAKRSLKSRGLSLPPWRKNRYMQNKWFGPYRRTSNEIPANSSSLPKPSLAVKCHSVGFDAVNGGLSFPATARTR